MPKRWYQRSETFGVDARPARTGGRSGWWIVLAAALALALLHQPLLRALGRALVVDEAPVAADAIMILGGGDGSRQDRALELYRQGLAPILISSGDPLYLPGLKQTYAELGADYLATQGIPREQVHLLDGMTSTREEAIALRELAQARGWRTLLVVTDDYHTGRARLALHKAFRRSGVQVVVAAAHPAWLVWDTWWKDERSSLMVFEEYIKLVQYLFKGYIL